MAELVQDPNAVGETPLAVVDEHQGEAGVGLRAAAMAGRVFNELDPFLPPTAKTHDVGHHAHGRRQRRDEISIRAHDEASILARRIECQHPLVRVETAPRGPKRREHPAVDRPAI